MLNKSLSYKILLRMIGLLLIVYGLYTALRIAILFMQSGDNVSTTLLEIIGPVGGSFSPGGVLTCIALGLFFLGLSSMHVRIAYWSLQVAIWLIGINMWYQQDSVTDVQLVPPLATPTTFWPQMVITLICSLVLLVLYIPFIHFFRWFFKASNEPLDGLAG